MLKKERNYQFRERMLEVHQKNLRNYSIKAEDDEFVINEGIFVAIGKNADIVIETAAKDFLDYLITSMDIGAALTTKENVKGAINVKIADETIDMTCADATKGFRVDVSADGITVYGFDTRGCAQGLYWLEKAMTIRKSPFIKYGTVKKKPLFSPQMVHSGFGLDNYPSEHLAQIAHDGRDAILLFVKDVDMTPYGYLDFNELIYRAAKYGIDVYAYSYIANKMHPSDPGGLEFYDATYGKLFRQCPGFKGVVLVEGSLCYPSKDPEALQGTTILDDYTKIPQGKKTPAGHPCNDMTLFLNTIKDTIRKYREDAELIVWTYTAQRNEEEIRHKWISQIPKDAIVLITYDKNAYYTTKGGAETYSVDYTLSNPYPSDKFISDIKFAHENGYKVYAMTNTGGLTWDMGVMPYQPGAQLWMKRYEKLIEFAKEYGLCGLMESHHYGMYPSIISKLSNEIYRDQKVTAESLLGDVIVHEYGNNDVEKIKEALQCMSDSNECYTATGLDQCSTLRIGAAWPLNIKLDLKPPTVAYAHFGNSIVAAKHEVEKVWQLRHRLFPEALPDEIKSWEKAASYAHQGVEILESIQNPNENLERLILLCKYIECQCKSAICGKKWHLKRMELDMATANTIMDVIEDMRALAKAEIKNAEAAIECTDYDSRLGWEPSMEYIADSDHLRWKISQVNYAITSELGEFIQAAGFDRE